MQVVSSRQYGRRIYDLATYYVLLATVSMKTKAEKREEKRRKRRSHKVSGSKVKELARLIERKATPLTK